jgi:hypothetical protein
MEQILYLTHYTIIENAVNIIKSGYLFTSIERIKQKLKYEGVSSMTIDKYNNNDFSSEFPGIFMNYITDTNISKPISIDDSLILLVFSKKLLEQKNYHCSLIYDKLKYNYTSIDIIIQNLINQINLIINVNNINSVSENYIDFTGCEIINNIHSDWFFNLINIYKKYGGIIPTNCYNIIHFFKYNWNNILSIHKTEIENIIEYNLGGKEAKNTNIIILNLRDWINRNRLYIPEDIINIFNSNILEDNPSLITNEVGDKYLKNSEQILNKINKEDKKESSIWSEESIESIENTLNELEKNNI